MDNPATPALFQYWDTFDRPEGVDALMRGWAREPAFAYECYSRVSAAAMIELEYGAEMLASFMACRVPAMQADFFRLCALHAYGGIYIDADVRNLSKHQDLLRREGRGLLLNRRGRIANDVIAVWSRHDPLMRYALDTAHANIAARMKGTVWQVTGPGIFTDAFNRLGPDSDLFHGFRIVTVEQTRGAVLFAWDLKYKTEPHHWTNVPEDQLYNG